MAQKIKIKLDPERYIKRCVDGYDTCSIVDATIFEDNEVDQVIEDLFNVCIAEKCEPIQTEEKYL